MKYIKTRGIRKVKLGKQADPAQFAFSSASRLCRALSPLPHFLPRNKRIIPLMIFNFATKGCIEAIPWIYLVIMYQT